MHTGAASELSWKAELRSLASMTTPPSRSCTVSARLAFCSVLAALAGAGSPGAQRPLSWTPLPVPGVRPADVRNLGKLVLHSAGSRVRVFSSFLRRWQTIPFPAGAELRHANDWAAVRSSTAVHAVSALDGVVRSVSVSSAARILNPMAHRNDGVLLVLDGNKLHAFAGLAGRWRTTTISPSARIVVERQVAVLVDGRVARAMSSLYGDWVSQGLTGTATALAANGSVGYVTETGKVHGFSAVRNRWATATVAQGSSVHLDKDVAVWANGKELLGFSGVRGTFARRSTGMPVEVTTAAKSAVAEGAGVVFAFSAARAQWRVIPSPQRIAVALGGAAVLVVERSRLIGYSALTGGTAPAPITSANAVANETVGAALDAAGRLWMFSAFTGRWHAAPADAKVSLPITVRNGALLAGSGRVLAFSSRSGRFVPLTASSAAVLHANTRSSVLAVQDGARLAVFEPRRETWIETELASPAPLSVKIWRTTMVATGATHAYGFSAVHGTLEGVKLPGAVLDHRASSEVGVLVTTGAVLGFGAVSDLTTLAQYPEFRRMLTRGITLDLHVSGPPGGNAVAFAGRPVATPFALPFGDVLLDVRGVLLEIPIGTIRSAGSALRRLAVPDDPSLAGARVGFQAIIVPGGSSPYLTRLTELGF